MQELKYISLGGIGTVTKNLHLYQYGNEILIVDCGLGFTDEQMLGVDLLLPDISYLQKLLSQGNRIVGAVITHGHEDHMGALPFILPQLPPFPIYGSSFTAAMANQKLIEFALKPTVQKRMFRAPVRLGSFQFELIRVTHSIPDTAHVFIQTPVGNFYHGSDFKFDLTPTDGRKTDFTGIAEVGKKGVRCLLSECLGAERSGTTPSEENLRQYFEQAIKNAPGRIIVTTYSSHIQRINMISEIARAYNRSVAFVGRSLLKTIDVARREGLLNIPKNQELPFERLRRQSDKNVVMFVAGSQGQEQSALVRIVNGEHKDIALKQTDTIIFSADPIPGNEISVGSVIDSVSKLNIPLVYEPGTNKYHVSGHGSANELMLLMSLLNSKQVLPISGSYRHMSCYKNLARTFGYTDRDILMPDAGQEVIFDNNTVRLGQKVKLKNIYVDEVSGEEVEQYVLHDRQQISQEGIIAIIAQLDSTDGTLTEPATVIARGFSEKESEDITRIINDALGAKLHPHQTSIDWGHMRKFVREISEEALFKKLKRKPLIVPIVIEV